MAYDNTNSGLLASNKRKEKPTHPDYSGSCNIDGREYYISGWLKTAKPGGKMQEGEKFFSLSFKPKDASQGQSRPAPARNDGDPLAPSPRPQPTERQLANQDDSLDDNSIPF